MEEDKKKEHELRDKDLNQVAGGVYPDTPVINENEDNNLGIAMPA